MKDSIYAYVIDCSLMKGKQGNDSEIIIFEHQPFICSGLGTRRWNYKNAWQKKFPHTNIDIDQQGDKVKIRISNPSWRMLIKNSEAVSYDDYTKIKRGYYNYVHTISFEKEVDRLNNKVNQRLYLPDEASPEYRILDSNLPSKVLTEEVFNYFTNKGITQIVLKSATEHCGQGNLFINDIHDKQTLEQGIKKLCSPYHRYFLAEEQKVFPRISRKTGEEKPGYLSYRIVGIANKEGDLGHFIATKSISENIDSHRRERMKCYFDEAGKTYHPKGKWLFEAHGPKDKYYAEGENPVAINPDLMQKISKCMYQLYADVKTMSDEAFKQHIDRLVACKNALGSRQEKIAHFTIEDRQEQELINKMDLSAFNRACGAHKPLAADIAKKIVLDNTANLSELNCNYHDLDVLFHAMQENNRFEALKSATDSLLNFYLNDYKDVKYATAVQFVKQILADRTHLNADKEKESLEVNNLNPLETDSAAIASTSRPILPLFLTLGIGELETESEKSSSLSSSVESSSGSESDSESDSESASKLPSFMR